MFVYLAWIGSRITTFHHIESPTPKRWPRLSVIVPACNEAEHIADAVGTLLAQDYPELEIILVNDRSTDNTGEIIDELAGSDSRIKTIHIKHLPSGWLGKVNALHQGAKQASGDWLLFTDADIHYHDNVLARSIAYVQDRDIDHLTLVPQLTIKDYWLQVAVNTFGLMLFLNTRGAVINSDKRKLPIGIGAFNLVKKATFEKTPGFEWLRLEVVDDVGVGLMVKNAGGRTHFATAEQDLSLSWYPSVKAMFKGLEKNVFGAGAHYQVWRLLLQVILVWALVAAPVVALSSDSFVVWWLGVAAITCHILFSIVFVYVRQSSILSILAFPLGLLLFSCMLLWSGFQCTRNGGIDWRGTHYATHELKLGQRVKF